VTKSICSIPGCGGFVRGRGWCTKHYTRWQRTGDPLALRPIPAAERFWPKVNKEGPIPSHAPELGACWLWTGPIHRLGYGRFSWRRPGLVAQQGGSHQWAYEQIVGAVPPGLELDHLCRVRNCVNPAHLEPVTRKVNMSRATNALKETCPAGHPYTPENTYMQSGSRHCRACNNEAGKRYRERQKTP